MTARRVLLACCAGLLAPMLANAQPAADCRAWPRPEFFRTATAAEARACLDAGRDPMEDSYGETALHVAARVSPDPAVVDVLVVAGADVNARDYRGETPLKMAASHNESAAVAQALLAAGADARGDPTLLQAAVPRGPELVAALLAAGADLAGRTRDRIHQAGGVTAVHVAAGYPEVLPVLLAAGAEPDAEDNDGWTPLFRATAAAAVELLLEAGADVNAEDHGWTPLHSVAESGEPAAVDLLLRAGADVTARAESYGSWRPLHFAAARNEDAGVIEVLLRAGADVHAPVDFLETPLHLAAEENRNPDVIEVLLKAGAELDAPNASGQTALFRAAAANRNLEVFERLFAAGADADRRDENGGTVLHAAAGNENGAIALLLAAGADVNARDRDGETPLHVAAMLNGWATRWVGHVTEVVERSTAGIEALLDAGAVVDARSNDGWTPLLRAAARSENAVVVELLLEAGADMDARNPLGETPLDLASDRSPGMRSGRSPSTLREVLIAHPLPDPPTIAGVEHIEVFRDCPGCPELVAMPAGRFRMGCVSGSTACEDEERPVHEVEVAAFALGRFEVTREEFAAFVGATGHEPAKDCTLVEGSWRNQRWQGDDHPVVCVSWDDARTYVAWLSAETGHRYRLPTESEWEYAARAGTRTRFYWGYRDAEACQYANLGDCGDGWETTAAVGSFTPNGFGLYDMAGNAKEFVEDCWHGDYEGAPRDGSAWILGGDCTRRVVRGGSWLRYTSWRVPFLGDREQFAVGPAMYDIGFRVARAIER